MRSRRRWCSVCHFERTVGDGDRCARHGGRAASDGVGGAVVLLAMIWLAADALLALAGLR